MKKIKVMELIPTLGAGGAEHFVLDLCRYLDKDRFEVLLVSFFSPEKSAPMYLDLIEKKHIRCIFLNKKEGMDLSMFQKLTRLFRQERPDVVHSNLYTAVYSMMPARRCKVPCCVHTVHTLAEKEMPALYQKILAHYYRRGQLIPVAISGEVQQSIVKRYGLSEKQVPRIHNGVDFDRFYPQKGNQERNFLSPRFICVGSLYPHKNHKLLLHAFQLLHKKIPGAVLTIAGDGPLKAELEQEAEGLGIAGAVSFLGTIARVEEVLRQQDIFVLSSDYEGFALVVVEAMACGLPAVATRSGGPESIIQDGQNGFLVPVGDAEAMANRMAELCSEDRYRLFSRRAVDRAQDFGVLRMTSEYERLFVDHIG